MLRLGWIVFLHQIVPFLERFQNIESAYFLQRSGPNDMVVVPVAEKKGQQDKDGDCQHRAKAGKEIQPRLCRCFPVVGARGDEKSAADDQYRRDTQQSRHMFFCELRVESSAAGAREIEIKKDARRIPAG